MINKKRTEHLSQQGVDKGIAIALLKQYRVCDIILFILDNGFYSSIYISITLP
jgi:hypothetical protein